MQGTEGALAHGGYTVAALLHEARQLSDEDFGARYGDFFFMRGAGPSSLRRPRVFQETSKGEASPGNAVREPHRRRAGADVLEFMIFTLRPHDPRSRRVTVGRTGNNDLAIPDLSVSKFHAVLTRDDSGGFQLKDVGSRTGTRVNDELLPVDRWRSLRGGEEVAFGDVQMTYLGLQSVLMFLRRVIPPT
jgi:hypothetical protein